MRVRTASAVYLRLLCSSESYAFEYCLQLLDSPTITRLFQWIRNIGFEVAPVAVRLLHLLRL